MIVDDVANDFILDLDLDFDAHLVLDLALDLTFAVLSWKQDGDGSDSSSLEDAGDVDIDDGVSFGLNL